MSRQPIDLSQKKRMGPQPAQYSAKQITLLAALVAFLGNLFFYPSRSISVLGFLQQGPAYLQTDRCWAETVVHPVLLWHPFPRQILVAGDGTDGFVQESLRHIATTPIHWIDSISSDISKDADVLSRVVRHREHSVDSFIASQNLTFDAVILNRTPSPVLVLGMAEKLAPGGVLAFLLPEVWEDLLLQALAVFEHVHLFAPYDSSGKSQYYALATNSDAYAPPTHLSVTYVNTLIGRRVVHKSSLQHYDGEVHLRMFLLQRQARLKLRTIYAASPNRSFTSKPNLVPFFHENDSTNATYSKIITLSRDFILCGNPPLSEAEAIEMVVNSLRNGEGVSRRVISYSWDTYQNISTEPEVDTAAINTSPVLDTSTPSDSLAPAQIVVTAIFDGGSLSLHVLPYLGLTRASIVNSNGWVSSEDILDTLGSIQRCERSSGVTHPGPSPLIPSNTLNERLSHFGDDATCSLHNWKLLDPYWMSPKVDARTSLVDGTGNWANSDISKDEVIFRGPIEAELVHIEEYKQYPAWKKLHFDHFGEQAHDEILVGPSRGLEIVSYFTNHACSPNIKYHDSYDVMVAIRNISVGEEVTFDYATSGALDASFECKCGAKICRHGVTSSDWSNKHVVQNLGKEAFWPYLKAKIIRMQEGVEI